MFTPALGGADPVGCRRAIVKPGHAQGNESQVNLGERIIPFLHL